MTESEIQTPSGKVERVRSRTVSRTRQVFEGIGKFLAYMTGFAAIVAFIAPPVLQNLYRDAVTALAAPHEQKAALVHDHLQQQIDGLRANDDVLSRLLSIGKDARLADEKRWDAFVAEYRINEATASKWRTEFERQLTHVETISAKIEGHIEMMDSERHTLQQKAIEVDRRLSDLERASKHPPRSNDGGK